ncbi:MAG: PQQ-binding-like beta-propeller repeat protein [Phycisphaerae bacterium]
MKLRTLTAVALFGCLAAVGAAQPNAQPAAPDKAPADAWPVFRGTAGLTGVSGSALPAVEKLEVLWRFKTDQAVTGTAAIADGVVYIGSQDKNLYALNLATGKKRWAYQADDAFDAPAMVHDGKVYIGSLDGVFHAVDAKTGKKVWSAKTEDKIMGGANLLPASGPGQADRILVGSYDFSLYCFDAKSGKKLWTYKTDNYINATPAVSDGKAMFGGCDALIHVVDIVKGRARQQIDAGAYISNAAAAVGPLVYVGNYEGELLCGDTRVGKTRWVYSGDNEDPFFSAPAVTADAIVFGGRDGDLYCLDVKTGNKKWTFRTRDQVDSSPVIVGDKVIFGSQDGRVYLLELKTGKKLWQYETASSIISSPAVASGVVIIGADDGNVYAFGAKSAE